MSAKWLHSEFGDRTLFINPLTQLVLRVGFIIPADGQVAACVTDELWKIENARHTLFYFN